MSARRAARRARHSPSPSRSPFWRRIAMVAGTFVAVAMAASAVVWFLGMRTPAEASACRNPDEVSVGADAAMAPVLEQAASRIPPEACVKKISAATGGTSYVARAPEDIPAFLRTH